MMRVRAVVAYRRIWGVDMGGVMSMRWEKLNEVDEKILDSIDDFCNMIVCASRSSFSN